MFQQARSEIDIEPPSIPLKEYKVSKCTVFQTFKLKYRRDQHRYTRQHFNSMFVPTEQLCTLLTFKMLLVVIELVECLTRVLAHFSRWQQWIFSICVAVLCVLISADDHSVKDKMEIYFVHGIQYLLKPSCKISL